MAIVVYFLPSLDSLILTLLVKILVGAIIYLVGSMIFKIETFQYLLAVVRETVKGKVKK